MKGRSWWRWRWWWEGGWEGCRITLECEGCLSTAAGGRWEREKRRKSAALEGTGESEESRRTGDTFWTLPVGELRTRTTRESDHFGRSLGSDLGSADAAARLNLNGADCGREFFFILYEK